MRDLWEWEAIWPGGRKQQFQTMAPPCETEAAILAHLKKHYPNVNIVSLRRCHPREAKSSTGSVDRHAYQYGLWDRVMNPAKPDEIKTIKSMFQRERLLKLAGYVPIRQRVAPLVR